MSRKILLLLAGSLAGLFSAEAFSCLILPPARSHPTPYVRMQSDPLCGYRYAPDQTGYISSGKAAINSWGFRGENWPLKKSGSIRRIVLLGDSYVLGQGVKDEDVFAVKLENLLNQMGQRRNEVLNFGISGYDAGHEIKVLENYAVKFHPDVVVLHFFLNDLLFTKTDTDYSALFSQKPPPLWKLKLLNFFRHSRLAMHLWDLRPGQKSDAMRKIIHDYVTLGKQPPEGLGQAGWLFELEKMKRFRDLSLQYHFQPVFAVIPTPQEITDHIQSPYQEFLQKKAYDLGITPVLLFAKSVPEVRRHKSFSNYLIPYDNHLSEDGHKSAARSLAEVIEKLGEQSIDSKSSL